MNKDIVSNSSNFYINTKINKQKKRPSYFKEKFNLAYNKNKLKNNVLHNVLKDIDLNNIFNKKFDKFETLDLNKGKISCEAKNKLQNFDKNDFEIKVGDDIDYFEGDLKRKKTFKYYNKKIINIKNILNTKKNINLNFNWKLKKFSINHIKAGDIKNYLNQNILHWNSWKTNRNKKNYNIKFKNSGSINNFFNKNSNNIFPKNKSDVCFNSEIIKNLEVKKILIIL